LREAALSAVIIGVVLACAAYSVMAALPNRALRVPGTSTAPQIQAVMPEGWGFFTKDARYVRNLVYRHDGPRLSLVNEPLSAHLWPTVDFDRTPRLLDAEIDALTSLVDSHWWSLCTAGYATCAASAPRHFVSFPLLAGPLCGNVTILRQAPEPWAYSGLPNARHLPAQLANLEVECARS
jgi:hypothetical protein